MNKSGIGVKKNAKANSRKANEMIPRLVLNMLEKLFIDDRILLM